MNGRFRRAGPARTPKARVLVVTEGTVTEAGYLKRFDRLHGTRSAKLVIIPLGADPRAVVERAIKEKKRAHGDLDAEQDSFWAVFDRDEHARFSEAIDLARGNGIRTAISDPCVELWAILHYELLNAPCSRRDCQRRLRELCESYGSDGKRFEDDEVIRGRHGEAVRRAKVLLRRRHEEGTPHGNPSTTMHELAEFVRCWGT